MAPKFSIAFLLCSAGDSEDDSEEELEADDSEDDAEEELEADDSEDDAEEELEAGGRDELPPSPQEAMPRPHKAAAERANRFLRDRLMSFSSLVKKYSITRMPENEKKERPRRDLSIWMPPFVQLWISGFGRRQ